MEHRITYIELGPFEHAVRCSCRKWAPPQVAYRTAQMAEDEGIKHLRMVERARYHLRQARQPSLTAIRDYYVERAGDPETPPEVRGLWQRLADEISHRLNDGVPTEEQGSLF